MIEYSAIILQILQGLLGSLNSLVGVFLSIVIFGIPLLIFIATFDLIRFLLSLFVGDEVMIDD
jgi:hypothetical protein